MISFDQWEAECISSYREQAINDFVTAYEREPTEDEIENEIEALRDRDL